MTAPRVGKGELARPSPAAPGPSWAQPWTGALTSPYGILIVFPAIVLAVGVFLTLIGQTSLRASNVALGQERLSDQAEVVAAHLRSTLAEADPMLDRLFDFALDHAPDKPIENAAGVLSDVIRGRRGVAYASISFPDGTFQGAYLDDDGVVRFQDSRVGASETRVRRYDYRGHSGLSLRGEESSRYDPRTRSFYRDADQKRERLWTQPYPFYATHYTGVTRAAPVYRQVAGQPRLHAVLTIDFDVNALTQLLRSGELPDMRTLLFSTDGTLLAYPQGAQRIKLLSQHDRVLTYRDLGDATLNAFFRQLSAGGSTPLRFDVGTEPYLATVVAVEHDPTLRWSVAYLVPERVFFESLHAYSRRSFAIAAAAVLLALGVSIAFARLVVRVRREAAEARAEARRASREARELGSYRLVACLGKGGMGEVWRAEHRLLAREAAIKLIRFDTGAQAPDEARERFRREAQTLAALRSRNTIELFDYGVAADGTFFYVMELLDGLDLESLVLKHGPQPPGRVITLLAQACRSLAEAHTAGLVHRDIKPANLFVCRAADEVDVVKVLDFGLVRALSGGEPDAAPLSVQQVARSTTAGAADGALTRAGLVMGTPEFMAPEQALGQSLDGRVDLYALGCVGFWLLTARVVFQRPSAMLQLLAHIQEAPEPLAAVAPVAVPQGLEAALMACLAKSPADRPQSARELLSRLEGAERDLAEHERWREERARAWWCEHVPTRRSAQPAGAVVAADATRIADASA
jgi:serine/threonine protein kinase